MGPDLPVGDGGDDVLAGLSLVLPVIPLGEVLGDLIVRESGELGGYLCTQAGRAVKPRLTRGEYSKWGVWLWQHRSDVSWQHRLHRPL